MKIKVTFNDGITITLQADRITENNNEIILHENKEKFYTAIIRSQVKNFSIGDTDEETHND